LKITTRYLQFGQRAEKICLLFEVIEIAGSPCGSNDLLHPPILGGKDLLPLLQELLLLTDKQHDEKRRVTCKV
jgi:hypothetical protein